MTDQNGPLPWAYNPYPYIPETLSELMDYVVPMMGDAPLFKDDSGYLPDQSIDKDFFGLIEGFGKVRDKIGEEQYAAAMEMAARAKALFLEDPEDTNGKTLEGIRLIRDIADIVDAARARRFTAGLKDDEGRVTGD